MIKEYLESINIYCCIDCSYYCFFFERNTRMYYSSSIHIKQKYVDKPDSCVVPSRQTARYNLIVIFCKRLTLIYSFVIHYIR